MANNAARIEPLEGRRDDLSIRVIVAGNSDYHRPIAGALASKAVSLVDLAETEEELFDKLKREEFDCLIADETFGGRSTLELRQKIDKHFTAAPAMVLLTDAPDQKATLKAFRNGVSDVVVRDANRRIEHRERVLRRGRIILGDGFSTLDCIIRDISAHGARFTVPEGIAIPRTLSLTILDTGRTHPAIRRWQRGASIGVEFTGDAAQQQSDKAA